MSDGGKESLFLLMSCCDLFVALEVLARTVTTTGLCVSLPAWWASQLNVHNKCITIECVYILLLKFDKSA